jgi:Protein of unknown function (DUF1571)
LADNISQAKKLLKAADTAFKKVNSYSCEIHCQDRIKGKLRKPELIYSIWQRPTTVYLRWLPGPHKGLQVSYVPERDGDGKFMVRETGVKGMAGAITWKDDSALLDKLYPHHFRAHETSLKFLLDLTSDIFNRAHKMKKLKVDDIKKVKDIFTGREASLVVSNLSDDPDDDLMWSKAEFFLDSETRLPLHFKLHDFDGGLFGEYAFLKYKQNIEVPKGAFELKKLK